MRIGKAHRPSEASPELIAASVGVGIQVMAEICQKVLDEIWNASWICSKHGGYNLQGNV